MPPTHPDPPQPLVGAAASHLSPPIRRAPRNLVFIIRALVPYWEEALDALAESWAPYGNLTVISGGSGDDELHPWEKPQGNLQRAELLVIPPRKSHLLGTVWPTAEIWETLERISPAAVIIHEYSPYAVLSGLLWAKAVDRPCVVTSDVGPIQRQQFGISQRLAHWIVNSAVDGVLARTQDAYNECLATQKIGLLATHSIATRHYPLRTAGRSIPKRIIQVGSLIPRKGIDLLLAAFALAKRSRPELELVLVGSGDHQGVRVQSSELGVSEAVTTIDFLQPADLIQEYARSDLFVLASRFDSYGVVVHEAAAAGLPLVISQYAGASMTLVEEGKNGFRVDPFDAEQFSDAILRALEPSNHERFSRVSREIAERYDVDAVAIRTASWLTQLLDSFGPHGSEASQSAPAPNVAGASRIKGLSRLISSSVSGRLALLADLLEPDAFRSGHRDIVFLNRYAPFYREGIFGKVANWKSSAVIFSGKTLGNLKTAERVETVPINSVEWSVRDTSMIVWLASTLRLAKLRPHVVCTEMSLSLLSTWWLFFLRYPFGFRLVFWTHGFQNYGWRGYQLSGKDLLRLLWMRWADAVLFYSEARKADVEAVTGPSPKYFVAPNTLDTSMHEASFERLEREGHRNVAARLGFQTPSMIYVGRLSADKEVMRLVELLEQTASCTTPPNLHVVGGGELSDALKSACERFGSRVWFHGPIFDARRLGELIYCASIMVCPGYVGLNVVESLAMGCPFATIRDSELPKRHSPEVGYLEENQNAIFASSREDLGLRLRAWFDSGSGIAMSRHTIRKAFLSSSSIERQFAGMKDAFCYAAKEFLQ